MDDTFKFVNELLRQRKSVNAVLDDTSKLVNELLEQSKKVNAVNASMPTKLEILPNETSIVPLNAAASET